MIQIRISMKGDNADDKENYFGKDHASVEDVNV